MTGLFEDGGSEIERLRNALVEGVARWNGVEQRRIGIGDGFFVNDDIFLEARHTMRDIYVAIKLPKTHLQRAIAFNLAQAHHDPNQFRQGWVELSITNDQTLQDALTLARQGYMEMMR